MTQYFVVGQGTDPYKHEEDYYGCVNCEVDFYWNYPKDCLGVFGFLSVDEDEFGLLKPSFKFIDARNNSVLYEQELYARYRPLLNRKIQGYVTLWWRYLHGGTT